MPGHPSLAARLCLLIASFLTAASVLAGAMPPSVHAEYEEPPTLSASGLLAPELLKGPHHTVLEQVQNDGFFNHYTVQSSFGEFKAPSTTMLKFLINELNAIAEMRKVETDDTAVASLKTSGENTIKGIKSLFTDTEDTLKGAASGVQSIFHRASETIGSRDPTGAEDSRMKQVIGFSKSKGRIATSYQVNVYSRNQVLQEELDRLAWADYLGGLGVGVATSAIPGVGGIVLTTSGTARLLNEAINTTPASELWIQSRDKLTALGMDVDTIQLFLNHDMFSPALYTVMTSALESMREVDNLELFLKVSLPASTPEMARMITETAVLTAGYHKHVEPLATVVPMARITRAVSRDGDAVVILPTDHLIWTDKAAGVLTEITENVSASAGRETELWVLGDLSETMQRECTKNGWKVQTDVHRQLIPDER